MAFGCLFFLTACQTAVQLPTPSAAVTPLITLEANPINPNIAPVANEQSITVVTNVPSPIPTSAATNTPLPTLPPSRTPLPADTGWEPIETGLERRIVQIFDASGQRVDGLYVLRLNPANFYFDVGYSPTAPKALSDWHAETNAFIVLNGGYFTEEFYATGLTIADGVTSGASYTFGGMLSMLDGVPRLQSLSQTPYNPQEQRDAGLQAFPMLVQPGGVLGFPDETGRAARRTVVGVDDAGNFLLILTTRSHFTLHELSKYLVSADFNLDMALNLDGGPSSGIRMSIEPLEEIPALSLLPTVITIHRR